MLFWVSVTETLSKLGIYFPRLVSERKRKGLKYDVIFFDSIVIILLIIPFVIMIIFSSKSTITSKYSFHSISSSSSFPLSQIQNFTVIVFFNSFKKCSTFYIQSFSLSVCLCFCLLAPVWRNYRSDFNETFQKMIPHRSIGMRLSFGSLK